jgi:hypothetical protein
MHQMFENTRQHNKRLREMNQVFQDTRQLNERLQETNQVFGTQGSSTSGCKRQTRCSRTREKTKSYKDI